MELGFYWSTRQVLFEVKAQGQKRRASLCSTVQNSVGSVEVLFLKRASDTRAIRASVSEKELLLCAQRHGAFPGAARQRAWR